MKRSIPSIEQKEKYENEGYFIQRNVISPDLAEIENRQQQKPKPYQVVQTHQLPLD